MNSSSYITEFGKMSVYNNEAFISNCYKGGVHWDAEEIKTILKPYIENATTILDIGSHIGSHSIAYNKIAPNARIFAFEAQKQIYKLLLKNIYDNNAIYQITPIYAAVGHKETDTHMSARVFDTATTTDQVEYGTDKIFNYGGLSLGKDGESVPMITIDSLQLKDCNFMKVDVEGAEALVFLGAAQTIKKYMPVIYFESNIRTITEDMKEDLHINNSIEKPIDILKSFGYNNFINIPGDNIIASVI